MTTRVGLIETADTNQARRPATTRSKSDKPKLSARRLARGATDPRASRAHAEFEKKLASVCEHARLAHLILRMTPEQLRKSGLAKDHPLYLSARAEVWALYNAVCSAEQKFREVVILGA
jgi:hypothetical protein